MPAPGFEQTALLLGQAQAVTLAHVEVGAGDHPAYLGPWHRLAGLEVDHHRAGTVLSGRLGQPGEGQVAAITVDLADAGHQIEQVRLGAAEGLVAARTLLAAALLPAAALMADDPRRYHMKCAR